MVVTVSKWGNSQGFRVPKELLEKLNLSIGDTVKINCEKDRLIIKPAKKEKKYNIKELVKAMPSDYKATEEFDTKIGIEKW